MFSAREWRSAELDDELPRFIGVLTDVTRQRIAEYERDHLSVLSLDPICIGRYGRFLRVNPAWERAFGFREAELKQMSFLNMVHPVGRFMYSCFDK